MDLTKNEASAIKKFVKKNKRKIIKIFKEEAKPYQSSLFCEFAREWRSIDPTRAGKRGMFVDSFVLYRFIIHWDTTQFILKDVDPHCLYALCSGPRQSSHCPMSKNNNWIMTVNKEKKLNLICVCPARF